MKIKEITITNFRGIRSLNLQLGDLTVLIGENNTGKSTVLEAIKFVLSKGLGTRQGRRFAEYDFHLKDADTTPQTADPIKIVLHFAEEQADEWPESITQQIDEAIQLDPTEGINHIWLQATGTYSEDSGSLETTWTFLNSDMVELPLRNTSPFHLLTRFVPLFFLSALRDASQEFGQRGQFWRGFLKSIQLTDEQREDVEQKLSEVNSSVISSNEGLSEVISKISDAKKLVPLDSEDPVVLEAIPTRVFDMVGKVQVHLKSNYGAKLPLYRHGEGTQSLAVLMLFQAFANVNLSEAYSDDSTPILALEEPEAHLHPSAIRSLGSLLEGLIGQTLVTSHSGDLVSRIPISSLRRLYKNNGETRIGKVDNTTLTPRELQAIDYNIRFERGHYLFSKSWLLVEGESDYHIMPLLFDLLGHSPDQVSYSILEISQVIDKGEPFIKLAKALGIEWFLMADGDAAGQDYVNRANSYLVAGENLSDRALKLSHRDIEHEFWSNGYEDYIKGLVTPSRQREINRQAAGDSAKEVKKLIEAAIDNTGGKPAFAQKLFIEVQQRGSSTIPQSIKNIVNRVVQLSRG